MEAAFGCPALESYGAAEAGMIAYGCRHGRLHVNADWVILEPVDANLRPVSPGQAYRSVLVTNLANRVQPIIRYELGDSITLGTQPCACGSRLPALTVEGRRYDILDFDAESGHVVSLLPQALLAVVLETPGASDVQLMQTAPAALRLHLQVGSEYDDCEVRAAVENRLREFLVARGLASVQIEHASGPPVRDQVSGKMSRVMSTVRQRA